MNVAFSGHTHVCFGKGNNKKTLLSYGDKLESGIFCNMYNCLVNALLIRCLDIQAANNNGIDQTVCMRSLVCVFSKNAPYCQTSIHKYVF